MVRVVSRYLLSLLVWVSAGAESTNASHYLGPETCALCHKDEAAVQSQTAMANTWQGRLAEWLPPSFQASVTDDLAYHMKRSPVALSYSLDFENGKSLSFPVAISMGGSRHGLGFLLSLQEVVGIPLARKALVQARYAWSPEKRKLVLAPGCSASKPQSLESALGLTLSATFESRCLNCHGQPGMAGSGSKGGVRCEACHGAGSAHLLAISKGKPEQGILNPKRLSTEASMDVCAQCHVGLAKFSDPSPVDLLIANQVRAIRASECFIQSGKAFSCTACHNPHKDAAAADTQAVQTCTQCHSIRVSSHAAICPVNASTGCIGCHMPAVEIGPLHLVDHLIRVHPGAAQITNEKPTVDRKSTVQPISEYLSVIAAHSLEAALAARRRLDAGDSFYIVAREMSVDRSASIGGYMGRRALVDFDKDLQGELAKLNYGESTTVLQSGGRYVIFQRLPRDFRERAEALQDQAEKSAALGEAVKAIAQSQEALKIYPQFLRALRFIGIVFTQSGNPKKGADVLAVALRLYPEDAGAEFATAASLNQMGEYTEAMEAYQRVITLEPDYTAAYVALGMMSYSRQDWQSAVKTFRQGLQIDPLSAELSYDLSLALNQSGDLLGGNEALTLARNLDQELVARREALP